MTPNVSTILRPVMPGFAQRLTYFAFKPERTRKWSAGIIYDSSAGAVI
jgi:hypothetical protein